MSEIHVVHIYVRTYIHASTTKLARIPYIHIPTWIHTYIHKFFQPSLNQFPDGGSSIIKVYIHTYLHTYIHIPTYIHAYIHTYIHTYIYLNTYS